MNTLIPIFDKSKSIQEMASTAAKGAAVSLVAAAANPWLLAIGDDIEKSKLIGGEPEIQKMKRRHLQNHGSLLLQDKILGSNSGISLQSRDDNQTK